MTSGDASLLQAEPVFAVPMKVHIAGHLKDYSSAAFEIDVRGASDVLELMDKLEEKFPKFRDRILDEQGKMRPYINIFVNGQNARDLEGERTRLWDGDVIYILPSVAGG